MPTKKTAATATAAKPKKIHTRLNYCDLRECEGMCCSDGAFVLPEEAKTIHKVVAKYPEHFTHLPKDYLIDSEWGEQTGPKTNVRKYVYRNKPAHFNNTRCVFTEADGKCSLQTLAVKLGKHKWKFKPMGCWLFPMHSEETGLVAPARTRREDSNNLGKDYPGFATFTPCGKHDSKAKVWWIALKEEVAAYKKECGE